MQRLLVVGFVLLADMLFAGQPVTPRTDGPPYEIFVLKRASSATYLARSDGSEPRLVPEDVPLMEPAGWRPAGAWSPDRRKIAFPCADGLDQFIKDRGLRPLVQELDAEHGFVAFKASDGTGSAVPVPSSMLCVLNIDGSGRERLVDFPVMATSILAPAILAWSPDSTRFAFASSFSDDRNAGNPGIEALTLCVVDVRTRRITRLRQIFEKVFPFGPVSWSPDGVHLAFTGDDGGLYVVDLKQGIPHRIASGASAVFSPQDDRIAFFGQGGVFTVRADGSDRRRVWAGEVFPAGVRWSPDGRLLFVKRLNRVIDAQTGSTVGELEKAGDDHAFTPDSRRIVYACCPSEASTVGAPSVESHTIYSVAVDGSDKRKVSEGDYFLIVPAGSPVPFASSQRKSGGRIRGRVTEAGSGVPLEQAEVQGGDLGDVSIITDASGNYELRDLPAGPYLFRASKPGYTAMVYGQRQASDFGKEIDLANGQALDDINFVLPRKAALAGRLLDEFDRPVANMVVQALRATIVQGQRKLLPDGLAGTTTASGEYRLVDLDAGTYYVVATEPRAPTYYPGVAAIEAATQVAVAAGQERSDLTFHLVPARTARVTGTIVDSSGRAPRVVSIEAVPEERAALGWRLGSMRADCRDDGTFVVPNLPPGRYRLIARVCASCGADDAFRYHEFAATSLTVNGVDVSGLRIAMTKPSTSPLSGRIRLDGEPNPAISPERTVVEMRPVDDVARLSAGCESCDVRVRDDWSFAVPRLAGRWAFAAWLEHPGPPLYREMLRVKSVSAGERDVTDSPVNFSSGAHPDTIEIVVGRRQSAALTGSVDDRGHPARDYVVIAFSVDIKDRGWGSVSRDVRLERSDQNGRFRIRGLSAADYFVVALPATLPKDEADAHWSVIPGIGPQPDAELLERLRRYATRVSISASGSQAITLRLPLAPVVP